MCKIIDSPSCRTICSVLTALALLAVARCACARPDKDSAARAQAIALFAKALAVSDLRAPGSPPFEMRATITVEQTHGKPSVTGAYLLKWASPNQWREEIHFPNYTRVRIGGKNLYWLSRTIPYESQPVLQLNRELDFLEELHIWSRDAAVAGLGAIKFHQQKVHRIKLECVTLEPKKHNYGPRYCFDPVTGTLDRNGSIEFSNFISFAGKYFPGDIRDEEKSAAPVIFHVTSILPLGKTDSAEFQPTAGSVAWPSCDDPDALPTLESQVPPRTPLVKN